MHKRFIANIIARIIVVVCLIMIVPLLWALKYDLNSLETQAFLGTIICGILFSLVILNVCKIKKQDKELLNAKDGLAIVGIAWLALSFLGAMPLLFSGAVSSFTDAFFEIVSGFTTTGATIVTNIEALPRGILFWRSLTHWLGGMGIIVLCLALLPAIGHNAFQLYKAEAPGITVDRVAPRIKETAKTLWLVYFVLSCAETVLLMVGGMPLFDSLCHTFGTMATGGFSTQSASIGAYGPYIQWVIIVFMFFAGTNFMLIFLALKGDIKAFFRNEEFKHYFLLVISAVSIFTIVLTFTTNSASPLRESAFQVVSILTTTGYSTVDFNLWPNALRFGLICFMFIGGCGGSTGGGMKIIRFLLSLKAAFRSIVQSIFPNAVMPITFNNKTCSDKLITGVLAYFIIFILLFVVGAMGVITTEGCDIVTGLSASIAALGNIGPGLARVGATQNYAWISAQGKWILIFLMLAGRLELYSMLILFVPAAWEK